MAEKNINARIIQKHDTADHWELATGFIPKKGEVIVYDPDETNTLPRFKVGDGENIAHDLPFVDKDKLEKITSTADYDRAYVASKTGTQTTMNIDANASANSMPIRGAAGTVKVGEPVVANDAATKNYVDTEVGKIPTLPTSATNNSGEMLMVDSNGAYALSGNNIKLTADGGFQAGTDSAVTGSGVAIGTNTSSTRGGVAIGVSSNSNSGIAMGTAASSNGGVSIGVQAITNHSGGVAIGQQANAAAAGIAIGHRAWTSIGAAIGQQAVAGTGGGAVGLGAYANTGGAIGAGTAAGVGFSGGAGAKVLDNGSSSYHDYIDAIQLGGGTNELEKSLQIYDDNIYNATTHTLTVQNAQVNGKAIQDMPAPTTDDNGKVIGVQNGVYALTDPETGLYYVVLGNVGAPGNPNTPGTFTVTEEQSQQLASANCAGIIIAGGSVLQKAGNSTNGEGSSISTFASMQSALLSGGELALSSIGVTVEGTSGQIVTQMSYIYPGLATSEAPGAVKAAPTTMFENMTSPVGIDEDGYLWVNPGIGSVSQTGSGFVSSVSLSGTTLSVTKSAVKIDDGEL